MSRRGILLWMVSVLLATLAAALSAFPVVGRAGAAESEPAPQPLLEFKTANNAGWFYTLSQTEAQGAAQKYGFVWQRPVGKLSPQPIPGTVPMYRLRSVARSSYLVSVSQAEQDNLVKSGAFVNEGVLGYVSSVPAPGLIRLMRFSNDGQWRVGPESEIAEQRRAGFQLDGPVGWALPA